MTPEQRAIYQRAIDDCPGDYYKSIIPGKAWGDSNIYYRAPFKHKTNRLDDHEKLYQAIIPSIEWVTKCINSHGYQAIINR